MSRVAVCGWPVEFVSVMLERDPQRCGVAGLQSAATDERL
jgi:hypothetical protein